jgi:hypothetical protein
MGRGNAGATHTMGWTLSGSGSGRKRHAAPSRAGGNGELWRAGKWLYANK